jgi:hypothetical protein
MKKLVIILVIACFTSAMFIIAQQNVKTEEMKHPRIEKAIHQLEDVVDYLEKAPHDFGGYKEQAIIDSRKAIASLKLAMKYRVKQDNKK